MTHPPLKNKPLAEAILEVRWELQRPKQLPAMFAMMSGGEEAEFLYDPNLTMLAGAFNDRIKKEYPISENLDISQLPLELSPPYVVRHRFRQAENSWPIYQLGPGVLTFNQGREYSSFEDFKTQVLIGFVKFVDAYPKAGDLKFTTISLRYINSYRFDPANSSVLDFYREKLGVNIQLVKLGASEKLSPNPRTATFQVSYNCSEPKSKVLFKVGTGTSENEPIVIWEFIIEADARVLNESPEKFGELLSSSHAVIEEMFFNLVEGELLEEFER